MFGLFSLHSLTDGNEINPLCASVRRVLKYKFSLIWKKVFIDHDFLFANKIF